MASSETAVNESRTLWVFIAPPNTYRRRACWRSDAASAYTDRHVATEFRVALFGQLLMTHPWLNNYASVSFVYTERLSVPSTHVARGCKPIDRGGCVMP